MTGALVATLAGGGVDPDDARRQARDILDERRYQPAKVPRPFEGVLEWLGDRLRPIGELLDDALSSAPGRLLLIAGFVALVAVVATVIARRRGRAGTAAGRRGGRGGDAEESLDPARLEREADQAERRGELDRALRLRFRAGLLRLDDVGAISFRPSLTSGQVARRLRQPAFDDLAITFDWVAYGGRRASPDDVRVARERWPRVLAEARK
ncbi:MAG TPA: DUF4129 domain-containing protein [Acidimicrobiia bacterium]|nr:DUF4129 domain-containing protein [Acidimicrobiia bacterium]